jgi:hypothetical protein|tara:strand:+ start:186 stop:455 length:270 start_codon:yes stop_codon:yes gene_type:complete
MFDKRQETFFASRRINERLALEIEMIENLQMISIKNKNDHILIPLTNVAAVYLRSPVKLEQEAKDKAERERVTTPTIVKRPKIKTAARI